MRESSTKLKYKIQNELSSQRLAALMLFFSAALVLACSGSKEENKKKYACANGTAKIGTTAHDDLTSCTSCDTENGFALLQNTCVADGDESFVCRNGTPAAGTGATAANICIECNSSSVLVPNTDTCLRGFPLICDAGEPTVGVSPRKNTNNCASCFDGNDPKKGKCMSTPRKTSSEILITEFRASSNSDAESSASCSGVDDRTITECYSNFIELHNNTGAAVDLSNYALLYSL